MWSLNKKSFLEYLGKSPKDVRWIDRAIKNGIVRHDKDTGAYILCTEYIEELEEENFKLKVKNGEIEGYRVLKDGKPELGEWEKRYYELKAEYDKLKEVDKSDNQEKAEEKKVVKNINQDVDHIGYLLDLVDRKQIVLENIASKYQEKYPQQYPTLEKALEMVYDKFGYIRYEEDNAEIDYCRGLNNL